MIRLLQLSDIPAAMRLKEAAGWNQTELDWTNLLATEPEGSGPAPRLDVE